MATGKKPTGAKKPDWFVVVVAVVLLAIGVTLVISDVLHLFSNDPATNKSLTSNAVLGLSLIVNALVVYKGQIPRQLSGGV